MRRSIFILVCLISHLSFSQEQDTIRAVYHKPVDVVDNEFRIQYNRLKPKVIKVYPYALYAADILDQLENDLTSIKKRRQRNKKCRVSYKNLKSDFKYAMLDLYISEGKVLMKLISRETGMSVYDIIRKYRGAKDAAMFNMMGKLFEQDIKTNYVPQKEYVLEYIIKEIEEGKIIISDAPKTISKTDFKAQAKKDKAARKARKKKNRAAKKKQRKMAKNGKKDQ